MSDPTSKQPKARTFSVGKYGFTLDGHTQYLFLEPNNRASAVLSQNISYPGVVNLELRDAGVDGSDTVRLNTASTDAGYSIEKKIPPTGALDDLTAGKPYMAENATTRTSLFPILGKDKGRIVCHQPDGSSVGVNRELEVIDSVTREKIQEFAQRHPEMAAALRKEPWPVTQIDGKPATFAQVLDTPSAYQSCPVGQPKVAVVKSNAK